MKVIKMHNYYISLLVFLLGLGLVPAGLTTNGAFAETNVQATDQAPEVVETFRTQAEVAISQIEIAGIVESYQADEPVYEAPVYVASDQINIAGNTVPIFYSSNTRINAGSQVGLYGEHFLYGHNTANVFGGLQYLSVGETFTMALNGVTKRYQIMDVMVLKYGENGVDEVTSRMSTLVNGVLRGRNYDYTIMTCHGNTQRADGNGTTMRLLLAANEI